MVRLNTFFLDVVHLNTIMKLMITQTIRISEELEAEISKLAEEIGESKQTAIRLALREGIEGVRRKFSKMENKGTLGGQTGKENFKSDGQ